MFQTVIDCIISIGHFPSEDLSLCCLYFTHCCHENHISKRSTEKSYILDILSLWASIRVDKPFETLVWVKFRVSKFCSPYVTNGSASVHAFWASLIPLDSFSYIQQRSTHCTLDTPSVQKILDSTVVYPTLLLRVKMSDREVVTARVGSSLKQFRLNQTS